MATKSYSNIDKPVQLVELVTDNGDGTGGSGDDFPIAVKLASDPALTPLGYGQDTTISAASALPTVPAGTTVALIQVEGQNCRWRDDGVDPTASVGVLLGAGTAFWYRGTFSAFKIIEVAAGATLNVSFYQEVAE